MISQVDSSEVRVKAQESVPWLLARLDPATSYKVLTIANPGYHYISCLLPPQTDRASNMPTEAGCPAAPLPTSDLI